MFRKRKQGETSIFSTQNFFFWLFVLFFFWLPGAAARADQNPPPENQNLSPFWAEMEKGGKKTGEAIWLAHRELWHKRDFKRSLEELEKLYQWKLNQGIRNHYAYALALVRESEILAWQERSPTVLALLNYAEKMAPDLSPVLQAKARLLWKENFPWGANIGQALQAWVQSFYLSLANMEEALPRLANFIFLFFLSLTGVFIVFSFVLLLKYYSFCAHHWQHLLGGEHGFKIGAIVPALLLSSPLALGLGWVWLFIFWFIILGMYASRKDRVVMVTLLLLLFIWPYGLRLYASLLTSLGGSGGLDLVRANNGVYDPGLYQKIFTMTKEKTQDADLWHTLALLEKRMGRYGQAEESLLKLSSLEPNSAAFYNNLGNIYLITNRIDKAIEYYQKAIKLKPAQAEIHYNLGQAYLLNLQLIEAERQFREARQLAPQLISYFTSISSKNPHRLVIDLPVEKRRLWRRIVAPNPERDQVASAIWEVFGGKIPLKYAEIFLSGLLGVFILAQIFWGGQISIKNCVKCGRRICSRCLRTMVIGQQCSQCLHTFSSYVLGDPKMGQLKKAEVAKYQKRRQFWAKLLSHFFPGTGHLYLGHSWEGLIYLFILILLALKIFYKQGWIPNPWPGEAPLNLSGVMVSIVVIVAYYLFVQYRLLAISGGKGRGSLRND